VSSNLKNKTKGEKFFEDETVKIEVMESKGIRVGLVGLTTVATYYTTAGDLSTVDISKDYVKITHHYAKILRE
jgi:2',3'-cyclic-nucleotide 2'-phosphodiesterase (5'-nucleotidase family)